MKNFLLVLAFVGLATASPILSKRDAVLSTTGKRFSYFGEPIKEPQIFRTETNSAIENTPLEEVGQPVIAPVPVETIINPPAAPEVFDAPIAVPDISIPEITLPKLPKSSQIPVILVHEYGLPPSFEAAKPVAAELPEIILQVPVEEYGPPPAIQAALPQAEEPEPPTQDIISPPPAPALPELPQLPEVIILPIPADMSGSLPVAVEQKPAEEYGPPPTQEIIVPQPAPALPELPQLPEVIVPILPIPADMSGSLPVALETTTIPPPPPTTTILPIPEPTTTLLPIPEPTTTLLPIPEPTTTLPTPTGPYAPAGPPSHYGDPILITKKF